MEKKHTSNPHTKYRLGWTKNRNKLDYAKIEKNTGISKDILKKLCKSKELSEKQKVIEWVINQVLKRGNTILSKKYSKEELEAMDKKELEKMLFKYGSRQFNLDYYAEMKVRRKE